MKATWALRSAVSIWLMQTACKYTGVEQIVGRDALAD